MGEWNKLSRNGNASYDCKLVLDTSIDSLLGYKSFVVSDYDQRYDTADYYWGITPNNLCYEIMKLRPPVKPLKSVGYRLRRGKRRCFSCSKWLSCNRI